MNNITELEDVIRRIMLPPLNEWKSKGWTVLVRDYKKDYTFIELWEGNRIISSEWLDKKGLYNDNPGIK